MYVIHGRAIQSVPLAQPYLKRYEIIYIHLRRGYAIEVRLALSVIM